MSKPHAKFDHVTLAAYPGLCSCSRGQETMLVHNVLKRPQPWRRSRSPGVDAERRRRLERRSRSRERSGELPPPPRGVQVL